MASKYKYKAFISYRHTPEDIKVAEHLNDAIERYHIPKPIRESVGFDGNMDIFRDKNDLPVTDSLNDTIAAALRESEYLIVICSTRLKESVWVEKEIELFLKTHPRKNILSVLIDGEPNEVIPKSLLSEETEEITETGEKVIIKRDLEPLSADYRPGIKKSKKTELPRLIAGLLGCSYEELVLRQQKYKNRIMALAGLAVVSLTLIAASYVFWSSTRIKENYKKALFNQSEYLSEESIRVKEEGNNNELAIQLALNAVPSKDSDMPYNPHAQFALANAIDAYAYPSDQTMTGIRSFEGDNGENIADFTVNDEGTCLAAISSSYLNNQYLYLSDVNTGELMAKHFLGDETAVIYELFFSKDNLWTVLRDRMRIYSAKDGALKKTIKPPQDGESKGLSISHTFLNGHNLYILCGNEIYIYNTDTFEMISKYQIKDNFTSISVKMFKVSPDDKYLAIQYDELRDRVSTRNLLLINAASGISIFDEEILKQEDIKVTDMCFGHAKVIISYSHQTDRKYASLNQDLEKYPYNQTENGAISLDCASGNVVWKTSFGIRMQSLGVANRLRLQFRNMKVLNSGEYAEVIVAVDDNVVYFLDPKTGKCIQKESLPCNQLYLLGDSSYDKTETINLFDKDNQNYIVLSYDNDDLSANYKTLTFSGQKITGIQGTLSSDSLFVSSNNEIIQYKKNQGDKECVIMDRESFSNYLQDTITFEQYMAVIVNINPLLSGADSFEGEIRLYDLKKRALIDTFPFHKEQYGFAGAVGNDYLVMTGRQSLFYKYHIKTKKLEEINLSDKLGEGRTDYNILDQKLIGDELIFLIEGSAKTGREIYLLACKVSDHTMKGPYGRISLDDSEPFKKAVLDDSGTKAYLENSEGAYRIACFNTGRILPINRTSTSESKCVIWNKDRIGIFDGKQMLTYDTEKEKVLLTIKDPDIVSFTLTDDDLYYLGVNGKLHRVPLNGRKEKSSLITKYSKYKKLYLYTFNDKYQNEWFIDHDNIRLLLDSPNGRTMLEVDADTLELTGQFNDIYAYNKDTNRYCVGIEDFGLDVIETKIKMAVYDCYGLNDLSEKGAVLTNHKELTNRQKMRYGIE